jgi:hypothetical protein
LRWGWGRIRNSPGRTCGKAASLKEREQCASAAISTELGSGVGRYMTGRPVEFLPVPSAIERTLAHGMPGRCTEMVLTAVHMLLLTSHRARAAALLAGGGAATAVVRGADPL